MIGQKLQTKLFKGQAIKITMQMSKQFKMVKYMNNFTFWPESKDIVNTLKLNSYTLRLS